MIAQLVYRCTTMTAKLNVLLIRIASKSLCDICSHGNGCAASLRRQPVGFFLRETATRMVYLCPQLASAAPSLQVRKVTDSLGPIDGHRSSTIFHFHFSIFYFYERNSTTVMALPPRSSVSNDDRATSG